MLNPPLGAQPPVDSITGFPFLRHHHLKSCSATLRVDTRLTTAMQSSNCVKGWLTVAGWQACVASSAYVFGTLLLGLIQVLDANYSPQLWHTTLFLYASLAISIFTTTIVGKALPKIEIVLLVLYLCTFVGVLVALVCLAPHRSATDVFTLFLDTGGWNSYTLSFFVGISGNAFAFLGRCCINFMPFLQAYSIQEPTVSTTYVNFFSPWALVISFFRLYVVNFDFADERGGPQCSIGCTKSDRVGDFLEWHRWLIHVYSHSILYCGSRRCHIVSFHLSIH